MLEPLAPDAVRVLVIDDEPAICSALSHLLRRAGFDPVIAQSAQAAESMLSASIGAILLDLRMPQMRGDVFYYIAAARFPHLRSRTLFITGDISLDAERMMSLTGCPVLLKPFHNAQLVERLQQLVGAPEGRSTGVPAQ